MSFEPAYCYGSKLLDRVGWEIYLGDDGQGGGRWEPITGVRIAGDRVLITVKDGTTYATGYAVHLPGHPRRRRPGRPADRGQGPGPAFHRRRLRGHRTVRERFLQFRETGTAAIGPGHPPIRRR